MPQRGYKIEAIRWDDSYIEQTFPQTHRRALERVGFNKGKGDEVDWFLRFARMDLDNASPGDLLSLEEDFWALSAAHFGSSPKSKPTREEIIEIQRTVRNHLTDLADQRKTELPVLSGCLWILYPRLEANLSVGESTSAETKEWVLKQPDIVSHRAAGGNPTNLISLLGELLEKAGKPIVRCPHCRTIFLQSRRNQEYCSRSCQSVAVMQARRAKAKAQTKRKTTARKPGPKTSARGGSRHGKKRR